MFKRLLFLLALALVLAFPIAVSADGGVDARLDVGRSEITVGDVVPLSLTVTHPRGWRVIFPVLDKMWGDLNVRAQNAPRITDNGDGTETTRQEIDVAYFRPQQVMTPELQLTVVNDQGQTQTLSVEPTALNVKSVLQENDTTLRDIKPQAELWQLSSSPIPFIASLALAVTALGGASVWVWKQRPQTDKRTPRERALDELKAIDAENLVRADIKAYSVRVSDSLRSYLTFGCQINAHDLTTGELAQSLKQRGVPADVASQIISVLRACDAVKFANDTSDMAGLEALTAAAKQIVQVYPPAPEPKKREVKK
ncbi:MAG: hypothetical protein IT331_15655 [Anaerolineae bacterium]|nr:hypothetical protein [Anaerolineae bacterium]